MDANTMAINRLCSIYAKNGICLDPDHAHKMTIEDRLEVIQQRLHNIAKNNTDNLEGILKDITEIRVEMGLQPRGYYPK